MCAGALSTGSYTTPGDTVGLQAIGKMRRVREMAGKTSCETTYYLLSAKLPPERFAQIASALGRRKPTALVSRPDYERGRPVQRARQWAGESRGTAPYGTECPASRPFKGYLPKKMRRAARDDNFLVKRLAQF